MSCDDDDDDDDDDDAEQRIKRITVWNVCRMYTELLAVDVQMVEVLLLLIVPLHQAITSFCSFSRSSAC